MKGAINLDLRHPNQPTAYTIGRASHARFVYNVSNGRGSLDFNEAHRLYAPFINDCLGRNITPIVVLNHQTWGEERGYHWPSMDTAAWVRYAEAFCQHIANIIQLYKGRGLVYQIFNEQDTPFSVPDNQLRAIRFTPDQYGRLFDKIYTFIKNLDPSARVITGGYVSGVGGGSDHLYKSRIQRLDGIAFHPYLAGAGGLFMNAGIPSIGDQADGWAEKFSKPLYITEFGILDQPNAPVDRVAAFAKAAYKALTGKVVAAAWYAWKDGMDNGYGVADRNGVVKPILYDAVFSAEATTPTPQPSGTTMLSIDGLGSSVLNVRAEPTTASPIIAQFRNGNEFWPTKDVIVGGGYKWRKVLLADNLTTGWIATDVVKTLRAKL